MVLGDLNEGAVYAGKVDSFTDITLQGYSKTAGVSHGAFLAGIEQINNSCVAYTGSSNLDISGTFDWTNPGWSPISCAKNKP